MLIRPDDDGTVRCSARRPGFSLGLASLFLCGGGDSGGDGVAVDDCVSSGVDEEKEVEKVETHRTAKAN